VSLFRILRTVHKWSGIVLAVIFLNLAVTGFLLLQKKNYDWLQPPTRQGAAGAPADLITMPELFAIVLDQQHPAFTEVADIERVDFRPATRVHKVRSRHGHAEIQVDAVTGTVLSVDVRRSDLIEDLHDGSFWGRWLHHWLMPVVPVALLFLTASGLYFWLRPHLRQRSGPHRHA